MDKVDEEFILTILRWFEAAYFRNLALETILQMIHEKKRPIADWKEFTDRLSTDPQLQPQTRAAFQRLYATFDPAHSSADRGIELLELLRLLPTSGKIQ